MKNNMDVQSRKIMNMCIRYLINIESGDTSFDKTLLTINRVQEGLNIIKAQMNICTDEGMARILKYLKEN